MRPDSDSVTSNKALEKVNDMTDNKDMNETTMLGTYTLDGDAPIEPEIVLSNCTDTTMLGQLVSVFKGNPDIRFFLIENVDESSIDLGADFHFLKDHGNWILANHNTMMDVLFDDASFNPAGTEGTFSLYQDENGAWGVATGEDYLPPSDQLLVDMAEDDIFGADSDPSHIDSESDTFFIDPSVLAQGEHEILVSDFTPGHDTLELPEGMEVKNIVVDAEHDLTEIVIGQNNAPSGDDIVVKLLGVSQPDLLGQDYGVETDTSGEDLIAHLINSGMQTN